ncbi:MAG: hypothetical protein NWE89_02785 [Candidatus Bathyarchaeota archaeon]|nr:hypothetical protein [Candidatus Bathyarchaeota archaeon]
MQLREPFPRERELKEKGCVETGSIIGVWVQAAGLMAYFAPQERLVEKQYQNTA